MQHPLPPEYFAREDERDDTLFYKFPRQEVYLDEPALATLTQTLGELLPAGGSYLDLLSGWRTHLPMEELRPQRVVGLGLNEVELADNPQLDEFVIHNLNLDPELPFSDESFEAVLCTVSIQYVTKPIELFQEVRRVLKPAGRFIISFSDHYFQPKATAVWQSLSNQQRVSLIALFFTQVGGWHNLTVRMKNAASETQDPLFIIWAEKQ